MSLGRKLFQSLHFTKEEKLLEKTAEFVKAAMEGNVELILYMLERGQSIHAVDQFGLSAFHWACAQGKLGAVKCLLENGANPFGADTNGRSPIHHASYRNRPIIIRYLVTVWCAPVDVISRNGDTPLHKAVRAGALEATVELLKFNAKTNIATGSGKFVLEETEGCSSALLGRAVDAITAENMLDKTPKTLENGMVKQDPETTKSTIRNIGGGMLWRMGADDSKSTQNCRHQSMRRVSDTVGTLKLSEASPMACFRNAGKHVIRNIRLNVESVRKQKLQEISVLLLSHGAVRSGHQTP